MTHFLVGTILKVNKEDYSIEFSPTGVESKGKGMYCKRMGDILVEPKKGDVVGVIWSEDSTMGFWMPISNAQVLDITDREKNLSLKQLMSDLIDTISSMKTVGSPPQHTVSPDDITKFLQLKSKFIQLFKNK